MADLGHPGALVRATDAGFLAAIGEVREAGHIMLSMKGDGKPVPFIEDCAVGLDDLPDFTERLNDVFVKHSADAGLRQVEVQIVKRSDAAKRFVVLLKRWIVERTIAWLNRCRRLAKDCETRNRMALAFFRFASIRLMLRKPCNPM